MSRGLGDVYKRQIYNSWVLRLVSHQPFCGQRTAIEENVDIASSSDVFERMEARIKIAQTDVGKKLQAQADALRAQVKELTGRYPLYQNV